MKADFHIHSTASDGSLTPAEIISRAAGMGISAISITDHDSLDGVETGLRLGREKGVAVVPGIELNVFDGERDIHILGYWININDNCLNELLAERRNERYRRIEKILARLRDHNIDVPLGEVKKAATSGAMTRLHVAKAMVNLGYGDRTDRLFDRFLDRGRPGYVPQLSLSPEEAVRVIEKAGGIPVLAHPGDIDNCTEVITELIQQGIKGLEIYYPTHDQELIARLTGIADRYNLITTGGSDYHGKGSRHSCEMGGMSIPELAVKNLLEMGKA